MGYDQNEEVTFDAIRQFVVAPDRRYRIESSRSSLRFTRTGSQFDVQWLVRGARSIFGDRIADALEGSSRQRLVFGGIGVAVASFAVLVCVGIWMMTTSVPIRWSHFTSVGMFGLTFILGLVMIIAGVNTRRESSSPAGHDLDLPLADIVNATLLPPQSELARRGEPQVARLHLQPRSGSTIKLGLPTDDDLEAVKSVIPQLAA